MFNLYVCLSGVSDSLRAPHLMFGSGIQQFLKGSDSSHQDCIVAWKLGFVFCHMFIVLRLSDYEAEIPGGLISPAFSYFISNLCSLQGDFLR